MRAITTRQRDIFDFLCAFSANHGYSPAFSAIMLRFQIRSRNAVHKHLVSLEKKGFIQRPTPETPRAGAPIRILRQAA